MDPMGKKLNGTESQRNPDQVSCDRAIRYSVLRVRETWYVGDFLESRTSGLVFLGGTTNVLTRVLTCPLKNSAWKTRLSF